MAKRRQARLTVDEVGRLAELNDASDTLWGDDHNDPARRLLTAAVKCFASNGFHGTTTRDIPGILGLSPAALYVHFPSKEAVLHEVVRTGHLRALECIDAPEPGVSDDPTERVRSMVARYTEFHGRHHVLAKVCQYEFTALSPEHYREVLELRRRTNEVFRTAIRRGVESGSFAPVDVNRVSRAVLSLGIDLIRWYRPDGPDTPEQLGEFNSELALKLLT